MLRRAQRLLLATAVTVGLVYSHALVDATREYPVPAYSADALNALVAALQDADVDTGEKLVRLRGVTSDANWSLLLEQFRKSLADGVELQLDVFVIKDNPDLQELCARMFAALTIDSVSFGQSGTDLRPASLPSLDRLAEFARDCGQAEILITGHTDGTGIAANNDSLSRARAQAVADYLVERGASRDQLQVRGLGSARPIADDATRAGRARNRRIEFELLQ